MNSESTISAKSIFSKAIAAKPKSKVYSTGRIVLIGAGIFLFVIISSLSLGYSISEFENPRISDGPKSTSVGSFDLGISLVGISFEFVFLAVTLMIMSYMVYRHTDWPFVKNRVLLVFVIMLASVIISLGFWLLFRQDHRIPRTLKIQKESIRQTILPSEDFSQQTKPAPVIDIREKSPTRIEILRG